MIFLENFELPNPEREESFLGDITETYHTTVYPFNVFTTKEMPTFSFGELTILYGGNGSGKSTILNLIADKLNLERNSVYNKSSFFDDYVRMCKSTNSYIPSKSKIVTSDDIFDYMLSMRDVNSEIDQKREDVICDYCSVASSASIKMRSMEDYLALKKQNLVRRKTKSQYVRENCSENLALFSNGQTALAYIVNMLDEEALYLLDEPENSLSPENQLKLAEILRDSCRFFKCQIIISTHSPFLLAINGAKIYNLDSNPVEESKWTDLRNIRLTYDFFMEHKEEFLCKNS